MQPSHHKKTLKLGKHTTTNSYGARQCPHAPTHTNAVAKELGRANATTTATTACMSSGQQCSTQHHLTPRHHTTTGPLQPAALPPTHPPMLQASLFSCCRGDAGTNSTTACLILCIATAAGTCWAKVLEAPVLRLWLLLLLLLLGCWQRWSRLHLHFLALALQGLKGPPVLCQLQSRGCRTLPALCRA